MEVWQDYSAIGDFEKLVLDLESHIRRWTDSLSLTGISEINAGDGSSYRVSILPGLSALFRDLPGQGLSREGLISKMMCLPLSSPSLYLCSNGDTSDTYGSIDRNAARTLLSSMVIAAANVHAFQSPTSSPSASSSESVTKSRPMMPVIVPVYEPSRGAFYGAKAALVSCLQYPMSSLRAEEAADFPAPLQGTLRCKLDSVPPNEGATMLRSPQLLLESFETACRIADRDNNEEEQTVDAGFERLAAADAAEGASRNSKPKSTWAPVSATGEFDWVIPALDPRNISLDAPLYAWYRRLGPSAPPLSTLLPIWWETTRSSAAATAAAAAPIPSMSAAAAPPPMRPGGAGDGVSFTSVTTLHCSLPLSSLTMRANFGRSTAKSLLKQGDAGSSVETDAVASREAEHHSVSIDGYSSTLPTFDTLSQVFECVPPSHGARSANSSAMSSTASADSSRGDENNGDEGDDDKDSLILQAFWAPGNSIKRSASQCTAWNAVIEANSLGSAGGQRSVQAPLLPPLALREYCSTHIPRTSSRGSIVHGIVTTPLPLPLSLSLTCLRDAYHGAYLVTSALVSHGLRDFLMGDDLLNATRTLKARESMFGLSSFGNALVGLFSSLEKDTESWRGRSDSSNSSSYSNSSSSSGRKSSVERNVTSGGMLHSVFLPFSRSTSENYGSGSGKRVTIRTLLSTLLEVWQVTSSAQADPMWAAVKLPPSSTLEMATTALSQRWLQWAILEEKGVRGKERRMSPPSIVSTLSPVIQQLFVAVSSCASSSVVSSAEHFEEFNFFKSARFFAERTATSLLKSFPAIDKVASDSGRQTSLSTLQVDGVVESPLLSLASAELCCFLSHSVRENGTLRFLTRMMHASRQELQRCMEMAPSKAAKPSKEGIHDHSFASAPSSPPPPSTPREGGLGVDELVTIQCLPHSIAAMLFQVALYSMSAAWWSQLVSFLRQNVEARLSEMPSQSAAFFSNSTFHSLSTLSQHITLLSSFYSATDVPATSATPPPSPLQSSNSTTAAVSTEGPSIATAAPSLYSCGPLLKDCLVLVGIPSMGSDHASSTEAMNPLGEASSSSSLPSMQLEPIVSPPRLCAFPPMTHDQESENLRNLSKLALGLSGLHSAAHVAVLRLSASSARQATAPSFSSTEEPLVPEVVRSDMSCFKVANPTATLIDFLRWYFPPQDWQPAIATTTARTGNKGTVLEGGGAERRGALETSLASSATSSHDIIGLFCGHFSQRLGGFSVVERGSPHKATTDADADTPYLRNDSVHQATAEEGAIFIHAQKTRQFWLRLWLAAKAKTASELPFLWKPALAAELSLAFLEAAPVALVLSHTALAAVCSAKQQTGFLSDMVSEAFSAAAETTAATPSHGKENEAAAASSHARLFYVKESNGHSPVATSGSGTGVKGLESFRSFALAAAETAQRSQSAMSDSLFRANQLHQHWESRRRSRSTRVSSTEDDASDEASQEDLKLSLECLLTSLETATNGFYLAAQELSAEIPACLNEHTIATRVLTLASLFNRDSEEGSCKELEALIRSLAEGRGDHANPTEMDGTSPDPWNAAWHLDGAESTDGPADRKSRSAYPTDVIAMPPHLVAGPEADALQSPIIPLLSLGERPLPLSIQSAALLAERREASRSGGGKLRWMQPRGIPPSHASLESAKLLVLRGGGFLSFDAVALVRMLLLPSNAPPLIARHVLVVDGNSGSHASTFTTERDGIFSKGAAISCPVGPLLSPREFVLPEVCSGNLSFYTGGDCGSGSSSSSGGATRIHGEEQPQGRTSWQPTHYEASRPLRVPKVSVESVLATLKMLAGTASVPEKAFWKFEMADHYGGEKLYAASRPAFLTALLQSNGFAYLCVGETIL